MVVPVDAYCQSFLKLTSDVYVCYVSQWMIYEHMSHESYLCLCTCMHTGAVDALANEKAAEDRIAAEAKHAHTLRLPRRPAWSQDTTPDQLEEQVGGVCVCVRVHVRVCACYCKMLGYFAVRDKNRCTRGRLALHQSGRRSI
jgi:hypothetical protein